MSNLEPTAKSACELCGCRLVSFAVQTEATRAKILAVVLAKLDGLNPTRASAPASPRQAVLEVEFDGKTKMISMEARVLESGAREAARVLTEKLEPHRIL